MLGGGYWEGKLAGFLHDPLDKVLREKHQEFARGAAEGLLGGSCVDAGWVLSEIAVHHSGGSLRVPDGAASAASRD